jgi:hypothetical protein
MGVVCGAIVVALVARYGYRTTDDPTDAMIVAFLYAVIATFGLAGHAFAVFLWRHSKLASLAAGLIAVVALGLNLSNSLGAIAGRQDTAQQERIDKNRKIRAAEAELKRLTKLRDDMPVFVTTDQAAVDAAKRTADTAESQRKAECETRGKPALECRKREDAEREANGKLTRVSEAKAATDRANRLEADAKAQRELLAKLGPIVKVDAQGSAIAGLFRLPDEEAGFLTTVQQFSTAAVVELIILICLIGWEASRSRDGAPAKPLPACGEVASAGPGGSDTTTVIEAEPVPVRIAPPPRPKLVVSGSARPAGSISKILSAVLEPAKGCRVELEEIFAAYAGECARKGLPSLRPQEFVEPLKRFCETCRIKTKIVDGKVYLMDVRLVLQMAVQEG